MWWIRASVPRTGVRTGFSVENLKLDKLTHQDLGQMQMYVNHYDRKVKLENENSTIIGR